MLASFAFVAATRHETCNHALAAAADAKRGLDRLNADRARMGKPIAAVDLALHLGEVIYGNVGAMDRLDFTVIGPAINEVVRIEALCEPLGRRVLVSAELASVADNKSSLSRSVRTSSKECAQGAVRALSRSLYRFDRTASFAFDRTHNRKGLAEADVIAARSSRVRPRSSWQPPPASRRHRGA
jgi:class 3 adenylate cyclase